MTLYEFNQLTPKEKEIATMEGEFLADRREAGQTVQLYGVGNFYVELWYDGLINEVTMLFAFRSLERLTPYLAQVRFEKEL